MINYASAMLPYSFTSFALIKIEIGYLLYTSFD